MKATDETRTLGRQLAVALVAALLVGSVVGPVGIASAQTVGVSQTVAGGDTTVAPGDTVTVEVTFDYSGINGPAVDATPPVGWTVTDHTDDDGAYGPPKPAWIWLEGDGDGVSGSHTVTYTVAVPNDASSGEYTFSVEGSGIDPADDSFVSDTDTLTVTVEGDGDGPGPVGNFDDAPTDPDGDGKYEDVNGDGAVNVGDAQALFANTDDPVVQNNVAAFDFNDDGAVNVGDAQALFAGGTGA
jgi:hypothetical protein